jgi:hypothetical protein
MRPDPKTRSRDCHNQNDPHETLQNSRRLNVKYLRWFFPMIDFLPKCKSCIEAPFLGMMVGCLKVREELAVSSETVSLKETTK